MGAAVVVLAAGEGTRMGGETPKVYRRVAGRPLLAYSLEMCHASPSTVRCVVVCRRGDERHVMAEVGRVAGLEALVVPGGATRYESERAGLSALEDDVAAGRIDVIAVHDAARPFAGVDLLEAVIAAARRHGGAVPGLALSEPVLDLGGGVAVLRRSGEVVRVQTPQAFAARSLLTAYARPLEGPAPADTAEAVERHGGVTIAVVAGDQRNLKVTFEDDLERAAELARQRTELPPQP